MFASRVDAGERLGRKLLSFAGEQPVVLGITRGGVVVAAGVAKILRVPLFPLVIKKVSSPFNPEFAVGAVGPTDNSPEVKEKMKLLGITDKKLGRVIKNKTVTIVDDGVATGWTAKVAVQYAKSKGAKKIVLAVPVADREIARQLGREVDKLIVLEEVNELGAVGNYYEDFSPVTDEEVLKLFHK